MLKAGIKSPTALVIVFIVAAGIIVGVYFMVSLQEGARVEEPWGEEATTEIFLIPKHPVHINYFLDGILEKHGG